MYALCMSRAMPGRNKNKCFEELKFILLKENNKYTATCMVCNRILHNTAASRLKSHRNICPLQDYSSKISGSDPGPSTSGIKTKAQKKDDSPTNSTNSLSVSENSEENWETMDVSEDGSLVPASPVLSKNASSSLSDPWSFLFNLNQPANESGSDIGKGKDIPKLIPKVSPEKGPPKKSRKITNFLDTLSTKEENELNDALANFIFGCNIPLVVVESTHFKNLIKKLRPAYFQKLPGRKSVSTILLDKTFEKCISNAKDLIKSDSVLLIDGWKNSSTNTKTVTCMIHCANDSKAFLNAWDVTTESETGEKLADIVYDSIDMAKKLYDTNIYAVVSDNASAMLKMSKLASHVVWHSACNSHTANLLAKDVIDKTCTEKVTMILKEFKQPAIEKLIVERGGHRIKLACETRWCSYRDSYLNLLNNLPFMKQIVAAADTKVFKIKHTVTNLIFDDDFIATVKENLELCNPICKLINTCQRAETSVADAVEEWINLEIPAKFNLQFKNRIEMRKEMVFNVYALTAHYLHPQYDSDKLVKNDKEKIYSFLFKQLSGQGIEEWDKFKTRTGIFKILYEKQVSKPIVFWNMAALNYPNLATLAIKLLKIPASSAQLERVFSNWAHIHSPIRNRLSFDRSKKLMHIYYTLRVQDQDEDSTEIEI